MMHIAKKTNFLSLSISSHLSSNWSILVALCIVLILSFIGSIAYGQYPLPLSSVWSVFWYYDPAFLDHIVISTTRLSRSIVAVAVGASLAVAGVLMQALTRNPLASPSIFGINSGAVFCIVLFSALYTVSSFSTFLWLAFLGAAGAGVLVYFLGGLGRDGASPVRIVLAGAAITALFLSFTQGILVVGKDGLDSVLFWLAGSVSGRELTLIVPLLPYFVAMLALCCVLARPINVLLSGEDIAKGLGQNTLLLKSLMSLLIIGMAGGSVALAGNIGFIGLIVPHMIRALVGNDHKWLIPLSALFGAVLLLISDIVSRFLIMPEEVPIGVVTALLGTPFFIYLARKGG